MDSFLPTVCPAGAARVGGSQWQSRGRGRFTPEATTRDMQHAQPTDAAASVALELGAPAQTHVPHTTLAPRMSRGHATMPIGPAPLESPPDAVCTTGGHPKGRSCMGARLPPRGVPCRPLRPSLCRRYPRKVCVDSPWNPGLGTRKSHRHIQYSSTLRTGHQVVKYYQLLYWAVSAETRRTWDPSLRHVMLFTRE